MQVGLAQCVNKGMQRDYSMDKASQEFAYENHNIRITTTGNESFLSVTNEKSTKEIKLLYSQKRSYLIDKVNNRILFQNRGIEGETPIRVYFTDNSFMDSTYRGIVWPGNYHPDISLNKKISKVESLTPKYNFIESEEVFEDEYVNIGVVLGSVVLKDTLVLFSKVDDVDKIFICTIDVSSSYVKAIYEGNLGFNIENPIECLTSYENDDVQKVYWVDGLNPCRVINICNTYNSNHSFDFKPKVDVPINVNISKLYNGAGNFKSGIVQYAITLYNKFEAESNIVYISPLHYVSPQDRGGKVDELITCSFKIDLEIPENLNYQNARVYSIYRSSLNGEIQASIVEDIELKEGIVSTIDNNTDNIPVASTDVLFLNNSAIIANTITQQNNTLFLGNIKEEASSFDLDAIKEIIDKAKTNTDRNFIPSKEDEKHLPEEVLKFKWKVVGFESSLINDQYDYYNQLTQDSSKIKTFKYREVYRFGIQFQDESLAWTQTLWLDDLVCDKYPRQEDDFEIKEDSPINKDDYFIFDSEEIETSEDIQGGIKLNEKYNKCLLLPFIWFNPTELFGENYFPTNTKYRLVMAEASISDRSVICQGYVNPTLYNNRIGSVNSWNIKPVNNYNQDANNVLHVNKRNINYAGVDYYPEEQQNYWLPTPQTEIDLSAYNYNAKEISSTEDNMLTATSFIPNDGDTPDGKWQLSDIKITYKCMYLQGNLAEGHVWLDFRFYNGSIYKTLETTVIRKSIALANKTILANTPYRYKTYNKTKEIACDITYSTEDACLPGHRDNAKDGFTSFDAYFKQELNNAEIINYNKEDYIIPPAEFPHVTKAEAKDETDFTKHKVYTKAINLDFLNTEIQRLDNHYFINANRCSFHTPDIENIDEILNESNVKFRIVGRTPLTKNISDYVISAEDTVYQDLEDKALSFKFSGNYNEDLQTYGLKSYPLWYSYARTVKGEKEDTQYEALYNWVYLWNSQGLSHVDVSQEGAKSKVKNKVFANIFYGDNTVYRLQDTTYANNTENLTSLLWEPINGVKNIKSANSPITYIEGGLYKKDVHDVILPLSDYVYGMSQVYKSDFQPYDYNYTKVVNWGDTNKSNDSHFEPINIKYDSTNHIVFEFENTDSKRVVLPNYNNVTNYASDYFNILDKQSYPKYVETIKNKYIYQNISDNNPNYFDSFFTNINEDDYKYDVTYQGSNSYNSKDVLYIIRSLEGRFINIDIISVSKDASNQLIYKGYSKTTLKDLKNIFGIKATDIIKETFGFEVLDISNLNINNDVKYIKIFTEKIQEEGTNYYYFKGEIYTPYEDTSKIELKDNNTNYLWIGEFYKEFDDYLPYGGTSENALETNVFIPISDVTNIDKPGYGFEGDTYFQRWDSLRTYPKDEEEKNGIVDVVSLMIETHTNLDGRSDVTRGRSDVVNIRPNNIIDTINTVYSQPNNYITSSVLDEKYSKREYPSLVAWSLSKQVLSDIDSWANINLSNSIQLDSSKGFVNKLITHNNSLLAFQDDALALINYNLQTTISSAEGVPVEIANSGKVSGYHYISSTQGCKNKWSVVDSPYGIYFIDSNNKSINLLSTDSSIKSLSSINLMKDWILENEKGVIWNLTNNGGFKSFYDSIHNEVYFVNDRTALCYNELLGQFTSFYDYNKLNTMAVIDGHLYGIKGDKLHKMFEGDTYCNLFGEQKDYFVTYKINKDPFIDKTWTNIEYRADIFNTNDIQDIPNLSDGTQIVSNTTFDKLEVWNEYQYGFSNMSKAKPKFRIWRADIPRDTKEGRGLNRIRNPWIMIKLSKEYNTDKKTNTDKRMEFHDLLIKYLQ